MKKFINSYKEVSIKNEQEKEESNTFFEIYDWKKGNLET
jgi:hypothetical protein